YIVKNTDLIEANLPVFFGHVAATLDKTFSDLDDRTYDDFIDATTSTLVNTTNEALTPEFLEKTLRHAMGNKRRRKGRVTLDVIVALKLMDSGNYHHAIEYLTPHRAYAGRITAAIAYCYYALSLAKNGAQDIRPDD